MDGRSIPWLAKSSQLSDGGKTLTVQLRDGVQFSDGKPLTADDVTYSLNRVGHVQDRRSASCWRPSRASSPTAS